MVHHSLGLYLNPPFIAGCSHCVDDLCSVCECICLGLGGVRASCRVNVCVGIRAEFGRMTFSLWLCKDHPPNPPYHSRDFTTHVGIKLKNVPSPTPVENWTKWTWSTVLFYMLSFQVTPSWHHNLSLSLFLGVWVTRQCTQRQDWVIGLLASLKFDKPLCFFC